MQGYLIYDQKDIERNQSFIDWLIEESTKKSIPLKLYDHTHDFQQIDLPDYVINRSRHYQISSYFESMGIRVFNKSLVARLGNDKLAAYEYFKTSLPLMATYQYHEKIAYPCVVKKRDGHGGQEVYLLQDEKDLRTAYKTDDYIFQDFSYPPGRDLRVYVINNEIIASVLRSNDNDFKSNYSLGGSISLYDLSPDQSLRVQEVLNRVNIDYAGIDFLLDQNDNLIFNEIEDVVGARMLYNLSSIDVVDLLLDHVKSSLLE